ncbi:hypothetical protein MKZ38_009046 [Zalerion maritima]|uniref:Uncharacterized protein n=1 Tax=Zalerion maritima TaxID=339359 RepID=A0AAD5RVE6_9PEZI|nr:hypothetical protein MKZ38_009046 [Zalerion maritima]
MLHKPLENFDKVPLLAPPPGFFVGDCVIKDATGETAHELQPGKLNPIIPYFDLGNKSIPMAPCWRKKPEYFSGTNLVRDSGVGAEVCGRIPHVIAITVHYATSRAGILKRFGRAYDRLAVYAVIGPDQDSSVNPTEERDPESMHHACLDTGVLEQLFSWHYTWDGLRAHWEDLGTVRLGEDGKYIHDSFLKAVNDADNVRWGKDDLH